MEQYQSDFRTDAQSRGGNSVLAENSSFSLGTRALSEVRKLEPAKPQIEPGALKAVNEELDKVSSIKTDWANCRDAESGMRAEISKSSFDTMVEFDKTSDTGDKKVSRGNGGTITVSKHGKDFISDQYTIYNTDGKMTFNSFNTNEKTRVDEFFNAEGKLFQTTIFHVDSDHQVNQEIIFKGTEKVLESIEDRYWDGRTDVFKADEQGKLKLQKQ